jgi:hypothetical protein
MSFAEAVSAAPRPATIATVRTDASVARRTAARGETSVVWCRFACQFSFRL